MRVDELIFELKARTKPQQWVYGAFLCNGEDESGETIYGAPIASVHFVLGNDKIDPFWQLRPVFVSDGEVPEPKCDVATFTAMLEEALARETAIDASRANWPVLLALPAEDEPPENPDDLADYLYMMVVSVRDAEDVARSQGFDRNLDQDVAMLMSAPPDDLDAIYREMEAAGELPKPN